MRDPLDPVGIVLARVHEAQVAEPEVLQRSHHVRDVDEVLGLVEDDDDGHRSIADCGLRIAELHGRVIRVTTLTFTIRNPQSPTPNCLIPPTPPPPVDSPPPFPPP